MTQEFLNEIEALSLKFSSGKREEDINNIQSARHMILGVYQGLKNEKSQIDLLHQLHESPGRSLTNLSEVIHTFLTKLTEEIKSTRVIIGRLDLKRRSIDVTKE